MLDLFNFSLRCTTKRPFLWGGRGHFSSLFTLTRMEEGKKSTLTPLVFSFSLLHEDSIINLKTSVTLAALFSLLRLILPGLKVLVFTSASVWWGEKGFSPWKSSSRGGKSVFFGVDCGESSPKSYLSGRFWQQRRMRRHFQVIGHPAEKTHSICIASYTGRL